MGNTFTFISAVFIAIVIAIFGIQITTSGNTSLAFFSNSTLAMIGGAISYKDNSIFISFDNLKNIYPILLSKKDRIDISNIVKGSKNNLWIATNHGLFLSKDDGLTWNNFVSINDAISDISNIVAITPLSNSGKDFAVSILKNNIGYVYITYNEFFNLEKLMSFNDKTPSIIFKSKNILYMGMPNGQLIRYNIDKKYTRVIQSFNSPILGIKMSPISDIYIKLKSGKLLRAKTFSEKFKALSIPGDNIYSTLIGDTGVDEFDWDMNGNMYILSQNKLLISKNNGKTFRFIKSIPLLGKKIDTISVHNNIIRVMSENKILTSSDGGNNWSVRNIDERANKIRNISKIYFVGGRTFLQ